MPVNFYLSLFIRTCFCGYMWILLFLQNATWTVHKRALQVLMTLNFELLDAVLPFWPLVKAVQWNKVLQSNTILFLQSVIKQYSWFWSDCHLPYRKHSIHVVSQCVRSLVYLCTRSITCKQGVSWVVMLECVEFLLLHNVNLLYTIPWSWYFTMTKTNHHMPYIYVISFITVNVNVIYAVL